MNAETFKKLTGKIMREIVQYYPAWNGIRDSMIFLFHDDGRQLGLLLGKSAHDAHMQPHDFIASMVKACKLDKSIYGILYVIEAGMIISKIDSLEEAEAELERLKQSKTLDELSKFTLVFHRETRNGFLEQEIYEVVREEGKPPKLNKDFDMPGGKQKVLNALPIRTFPVKRKKKETDESNSPQ